MLSKRSSRSSIIKQALWLLLGVFLLLSVSDGTALKLRSGMVRLMLPFCYAQSEETAEQVIDQLRLENQQLRQQVAQLAEAAELKTQVICSLSSRVIYRGPNTWNNSLWIDVGERDNGVALIVGKNSPVLFGTAVVGVIDYVGKKQSRVRLITDAGLVPSVRVQRGELFLAKGELFGTGNGALQGRGFNYDFADEYGPARDLRTEGLLQPGDLLVTTGMDGVFPPGLEVARVTHVERMREGAYYHELQAAPVAGNISDLKVVQVLPPVAFDRGELSIAR